MCIKKPLIFLIYTEISNALLMSSVTLAFFHISRNFSRIICKAIINRLIAI